MLICQRVKIRWNARNVKYYTEKGYTYTKIGEEFWVDVNDLPKGSEVLVEFICDYCNGLNQINESDKTKSFKNLLLQRKKNEKDCCNDSKCINEKRKETLFTKKVEKNNSLGFKFPNLIEEWSERNKKSPFEYSYGSNKKVWWKCEENHEWEASPNKRASGIGCPYCYGRYPSENNNAATHFPHLVQEYHKDKNSFKLEELTKTSKNKVWWICSVGHEWEASIISRSNRNGCPYCSNKLVSSDNCLSTTNPELAAQFHPTKNGQLLPNDFVKGSGQKVWWLGECGHEWITSIVKRTNGSGCPICKSSKGEIKIANILELNNIIYQKEYEFDNLIGLRGGKLRFDFAIFYDNKIIGLIEFDGEFHYGQRYKGDDYEYRIIHDNIKNKYCSDNNIPLLRIPYWEYDKLEDILIEIIHTWIKTT